MIQLYHRTTREGVAVIPAEGFRDGEDGGVWFSQYLDCWGERDRHLLIVDLDVTEQELASYAVEVAADEEWDEAAGDFVPIADERFVERFTWYKIPADLVNARGKVRMASPADRPL